MERRFLGRLTGVGHEGGAGSAWNDSPSLAGWCPVFPGWAAPGSVVPTISPGIVSSSPLAADELTGPRGEGYRRMIELGPAGRAGTPDEVATVAALLMGPDGGFITGSDVLMDGGVTASYFFGELALLR